MPFTSSLRKSLRPSRKTTLLAAASLVGGTSLAIGLYYSTRPQSPPFPSSGRPRRDEEGRILPPSFPRIKTRAEQLADLRQHGQRAEDGAYDLVVIGGGATGSGIALDAVTRGLKVALIDRGDFACGTSSKSTKLVHGGVRYLEKAVWNLDYNQFKLVCEALRERKNFLTIAPHLSSSLPILIPLYSWWQAPYFWAGTKVYDLLAGSQGLESSYLLSRRGALSAFPHLKKTGLIGGLVYYDGQHNDSRMNISLVLTAGLYGATVANYVEATGFEKDSRGKICGIRLRDMMPGSDDEGTEFVVRAKGVINATGAFADAVEKLDDAKKSDIVCPSSGIHVALPGHLSPKNMGLLDANTSDGRVIFFLPWQGKMIAGTTDTPCRIERDPVASEEDISFVLEEVRKNLDPEAPVTREDVSAAWSGIRPLVRDPNSSTTESLVRSHLVTVSESGLLTCAGGKWTTYRQMAEDAVDKAIEVFGLTPKAPVPVDISGMGIDSDLIGADGSCWTRRVRLIGAHGFHSSLPDELAQTYDLDKETTESLAANYGDRSWQIASMSSNGHCSRLSADLPVLEEEIRHAVRHEYAQTAADVLGRRTRISFLDCRAALEMLPRVIDVMSEELSWDEQRAAKEWKETVSYLVSMGLPREMTSLTREEVQERARVRVAETRATTVKAEEENSERGGLRGTGPFVLA
ncbi:hypothetical protein VTK73DRAFT_9146 [Phialemonium thermophilum]|uniref:Glycerol-3-phosphate dehydrogenase n=1 Tax=Phialemonium thermophilum TaxID=223376 RepID=A0ABR3XML9_9PEZI